ncbi:hypothetical protein V1264_007967 [Littorina saxatilis]|uniref:Uncharacterized protein n=2 Tax=Littorina saxatilis TaxID=31220 RepID=A0AAN9AWB7_9CAEN
MAVAGSSHQTSSSKWWQIVTSLYPDALTRTYCVPPIQFNRVPYVRDIVPGTNQSVLVQHLPSGAAPVHNVPPVSQRSVLQAGATLVRNVTLVILRSVLQAGGALVRIFVPVSLQSVLPSHNSLWTQEPNPQAIPVNVQESDFRDDFAQNHVMVNLQELGNSRHEAMFILSQLSFGNYLNQHAYAAAAAQLPRPSDLDTQQTKYSDGEADFVLIHRQHGILIGELKSVGRYQVDVNNPQPPADADVAKRVTKAVEQLDRSERVVRHLVSDVAPALTVRKTLFLPYVSTGQLKRILDNNPHLKQAVCRSLGAGYAAEASQLCCCSNQLSQPASYWHVTPAVLSQLSTWWQHRMACTVDTLLTDDMYLDIVAR